MSINSKQSRCQPTNTHLIVSIAVPKLLPQSLHTVDKNFKATGASAHYTAMNLSTDKFA